MENNTEQNTDSNKIFEKENRDDCPQIDTISPTKDTKESLKKDNNSSKKKIYQNNNVFTPNIDRHQYNTGRFSGNRTFTDSPFDNQRRFIPNSNHQNFVFSSNYKFENSYSNDFNAVNPHLYLSNKDGNICINFFDSKYRDKNFMRETGGNSNLIKKINFDIGDDMKEDEEQNSESSCSFKALDLENNIKKPEPRKIDLFFENNNTNLNKNNFKHHIFSINNLKQNVDFELYRKANIIDENELMEKIRNKKVHCNCSKSKCLKLYCECFAAGELCYGCNCCNCENTADNFYVRSLIINQMKDKNPSAFKSKAEAEEERVKHIKGCNCTKSGCLKKYCECFQIGASCTDLCRCRDCKNMDDKKMKPNNHVKIVDPNTIVIKKKCLGENLLTNSLKFKSYEKFEAETISIQIMNNSFKYEKKNSNYNSVTITKGNSNLESNKKQKKSAKKKLKVEETHFQMKPEPIHSIHKQLITPIKGTNNPIRTSILNNSSQIKKNFFSHNNTNNSLQCSTTDKTRKRINIRKGTILCENLADRLTKNDIILNENH